MRPAPRGLLPSGRGQTAVLGVAGSAVAPGIGWENPGLAPHCLGLLPGRQVLQVLP